jgi:hypothetical protein
MLARRLLMTGQPITPVGSVTGTSGTALSLTSLGLQAGDVVVALGIVSRSDATTRPDPAGTGWTALISNRYNDANLYVIYKAMTTTPDTTVTLKTHATAGAMMALAFRGARSATPVLTSDLAASTYTPPALTVTGGTALSLCLLALVGSTVTLPTAAPSGWSAVPGVLNTSGVDTGAAAGYRYPQSGVVAPGAFTGASATAYVAVHLLLAD